MQKEDFIQWVRKLQQTYTPSAEVAQQLAQIELVALVGPTGVGKTTIMEKLGLPHVASDVTRPAREGEKNGHEYYFRSDFFDILEEIKHGQYVQFLVAHNNEFYGTRASAYPQKGPATMAVVASAIEHFRNLGFKKVLPIYVLPPGYKEWMRRIGTGRIGDFNARMKEAAESLSFALKDSSYAFVLNDNLETAVEEIKTIITGGHQNQHRLELARSSADLLLGRLGVDDSLL